MAMHLNQIAIIVEDTDASVAFYESLFGLPRVGGTVFAGKVPEKVQSLPDPHFIANWHMDDREFFQLELFQYQSPRSRPFARERRPWDIGYSRVALEVNDPVAVHSLCARRSVAGLSPVTAIRGQPYFSLFDPNGVLWNEPPARKRSVVLDGGPAWLELTEYAEPAPRPWPEGYRICDHGIMNVAFGFRDAADLRAAWERMQQGGFRPHGELVSSAGQVVVGYMDDPQSFNVELLMVRPWLDGVMGFRRESRMDQVIKKLMMALA